jgi:F-type H+-transporting ATPase subunit b
MEPGNARIGQVFDFGMLHLEWPTALFVLLVFFVTMFFLNTWLFKPILKTLDLRQSKVDKNIKSKEEVTVGLSQAEAQYQSKLADTREIIQQARQESLDEAIAESQRLISESKASLTTQLDEASKEIAAQREIALKDAAALTVGLSTLIKSKVLT